MFGTQHLFLFRNDVLNGGPVLEPDHREIDFIHNMALRHKTVYLQLKTKPGQLLYE